MDDGPEFDRDGLPDENLMELGAAFQVMVKGYSDILRGAVTTLIDEGWSDSEAREIALLAWKQAVDR